MEDIIKNGQKKTIRDSEVAGKHVLVRVDFQRTKNKETEKSLMIIRNCCCIPTIKYIY